MTSGVFSVFFLLVSLVFCVSAVDPVGVKIRITNQALDMLNLQAQAIIQERLLNRPFERMQFGSCTIEGLMFTQLNIQQATLRFQQHSGFRFEIQNFGVRINFNQQINAWLFQHISANQFEVGGVAANMEVSLIRNAQGRLNVAMPQCTASADRIALMNGGITGTMLTGLLNCLRPLFSRLFCPAVQSFGLPFVNQMLNTIVMTAEVFPDFGISIDYSVTRDVQVTATSLDMSFKGLVFRQGENTPALNPGVDPVFTQNGHMAYVGISEIVFNSGATSFYNAGALGKKFERIPSTATRVLLRIRQFFTQPWRMTAPLVGGIELTEAPTISISQAQGVTVNLRVRVTTASERANSAPKKISSVSATCQVSLMVTIQGTAQGNRLNLPYNNIQCRIVTSNQLKQVMVRPVQDLLNNRLSDFLEGWFYDGVQVPLPDGVIFTQGMIEYHNGFIVVGGNLNLTPPGRQALGDRFGR